LLMVKQLGSEGGGKRRKRTYSQSGNKRYGPGCAAVAGKGRGSLVGPTNPREIWRIKSRDRQGRRVSVGEKNATWVEGGSGLGKIECQGGGGGSRLMRKIWVWRKKKLRRGVEGQPNAR